MWAALRSLGRSGVADLAERLCWHACTFAAGIAGIEGATVLDDVVFTQVCAEFGDDERTDRVLARFARRRHGLDQRLHLARPACHAHLGEQLVDDRRPTTT
ncbi:hypothetical protein [Streptomyces sp. NPDC000618]|uniref:hypothetical protein n=1 Tax=Streptomyces sp. NPDC000618 TaxID=3154265 RepID=UPI00332B6937